MARPSIRRRRTSSLPTDRCTAKWSTRSPSSGQTGAKIDELTGTAVAPRSAMTRLFRFVLPRGCLAGVLDARPARPQQTIHVSLGYFTPNREGARVNGDLLNANRNFLT